MLRIIIEGERGEGKTLLANLVAAMLAGIGFNVKNTDPDADERVGHVADRIAAVAGRTWQMGTEEGVGNPVLIAARNVHENPIGRELFLNPTAQRDYDMRHGYLPMSEVKDDLDRKIEEVLKQNVRGAKRLVRIVICANKQRQGFQLVLTYAEKNGVRLDNSETRYDAHDRDHAAAQLAVAVNAVQGMWDSVNVEIDDRTRLRDDTEGKTQEANTQRAIDALAKTTEKVVKDIRSGRLPVGDEVPLAELVMCDHEKMQQVVRHVGEVVLAHGEAEKPLPTANSLRWSAENPPQSAMPTKQVPDEWADLDAQVEHLLKTVAELKKAKKGQIYRNGPYYLKWTLRSV